MKDTLVFTIEYNNIQKKIEIPSNINLDEELDYDLYDIFRKHNIGFSIISLPINTKVYNAIRTISEHLKNDLNIPYYDISELFFEPPTNFRETECLLEVLIYNSANNMLFVYRNVKTKKILLLEDYQELININDNEPKKEMVVDDTIGFNVFLIDKVKMFRTFMKNELIKNNIKRVEEFDNYNQCLKLLNVKRPDLIIFDAIADKDKLNSIIKLIKNILPDSKIILTGAGISRNYIVEAIKNGIDDFITKPANPKRIIKSINNIYPHGLPGIEDETEKIKEKVEDSKEKFSINTQLKDELIIIQITGRLNDDNINLLIEKMNEVINDKRYYIIIDFIKLNEITENALVTLADVYPKILEKGGNIKFIITNPDILSLFDKTGLKKFFDIYDDDFIAIKSFEISGEIEK